MLRELRCQQAAHKFQTLGHVCVTMICSAISLALLDPELDLEHADSHCTALVRNFQLLCMQSNK
jgi:hypothetical protein